MDTTTITYSVDQCLNTNVAPRLRNYYDLYQLLSEEDARVIAKVYKVNKARFEKLVKHKNKKFNRILKADIGIYKIHHPTPVITWEISDRRQPLSIRVRKQIENM